MINIPQNTSMSFKEEDDTNYRQIFLKLLSGWPWFVFSIFFFVSLGILYVKYTSPQYNIHARLLINDARKGTGVTSAVLSDIGMPLSSSVENEAEVLKTRLLMEQVVRDMKLNVTYFTKGALRDDEIYNPPFDVELISTVDTIKSQIFEITIEDRGKLLFETKKREKLVSFNDTIRVDGLGIVKIRNNGSILSAKSVYKVAVSSVDQAVNKLQAALDVSVIAKQISIVDLNFLYPQPRKGEDILNRLIKIYIQTNVDDRNQVADSSYIFIQKRLNYLRGELGDLEGNIQNFKQRNQIAEMSQQSSVIIQNSSQYENDLAKVETQLNVLKSIKEYIKNNEKGDRIVPSSLIVSDPLFTSLVEKYNSLLLERDRRLIGVNESNPVIVNLDNEIDGLRIDMLASLNSIESSLEINKSSLINQTKQVENQVRGVPEIERNYLEMARQQKIKQDLYIFLMQKGEEMAIAKTYNTPNSKNIDPPKAEGPVSPKKMIFYVASILLGVILPAVVIYAKFLLNTKVDSKDDVLRHTQTPIIGEISHSASLESLQVVNHSRSAISEQFRALRTNLSFYLNSNKDKIILLTSSMSGEGKSFVALNLASVLALSGNKVLLMELDLRKPGLSFKLGIPNLNGFSNYIIDSKLEPENIIKPLNDILPNLHIINSGPVPPNPAELLLNPRTEELFEKLRTRFDFIIVDAPPVGLVTDAQLMSSFTDMCIYIVRQKYTAKEQLKIVEELRRENKMKRLGIVVNDIKHEGGSGYGYGYGYGYGTYGEDYDGNLSTTRARLRKLFKRE